MRDALITVVVPAHGVVETLEASVLSALGATSGELEVIIVDDAATDGSAQVADRLAEMDRVRVVHRASSGGPGAARNDGLRRAKGEYVCCLDGDDRLRPGSLDRLRSSFAADTVAVLGRFHATDDEGRDLDIGTWANEQLHPVVRRRGKMVPSSEGFTPEALLTRLVTPPPGAILVRTDDARAVGGYDITIRRSEDIEFLVRLSDRGRLVPLDEEVLDYRRRRAQRSAQVRARRYGRQRTLIEIIARAPSRQDARVRARGVVAHHLDRASTRWRYSDRSLRDLAVVLRSTALACGFFVVGVAAQIAPR